MENPNERINVGVRLLPSSLALLDAAAVRTGRSRTAVIELLLSLHAEDVTPDMAVPFGAIPAGSRHRKGTGRGGKGRK